MAVTRNYSITLSVGTIANVQVTGSVTGDAEPLYNGDISNGVTDQEVQLVWRAAGLKAWVILADGVVTVETNSSSAPDNTWTTVANVPIFWVTGLGWANPITVDVAKFYLTNASGSTRNVQLYAVSDQTP